MPTRHVRRAALAAAILLLALPARADIEKTFTFEGDELTVADMIGEVSITRARGDRFTVKATIRGADAGPEVLDFAVEEGRDARLTVLFPVDDEDDYVYPPLGRGESQIRFQKGRDDGSWLRKLFGGDKVTIKGRGGGLEVWADLEIGVPDGGSLDVYLGVGGIDARDVDGDLYLDTHSGGVAVRDVEGDVGVDTGSGGVEVRGVTGDVHVDTGSGGVIVRDVEGDKVLVDTGSGGVQVEDATCADLHVDTGSGGVVARGIRTDKAKIDTGSGSVELVLDAMGTGRFVIDTGSGGIELALPRDASARIEADTGSGRIRNEIEDADVRHLERDELLMTVGGGEARVTLDAGSGSITIRRI